MLQVTVHVLVRLGPPLSWESPALPNFVGELALREPVVGAKQCCGSGIGKISRIRDPESF